MKTIITLIIVAFVLPAVACNEPINYSGTCPLGYYRSGGYCVSNR
jgi:hypothetical protein